MPLAFRAVIGSTRDARNAGASPNSALLSMRDHADEGEKAPVDAQIEQDGILCRREDADDCRRREHRERHADEAGGGGDERALDEHLLDQAAAAGSQ